MEILIVVSGNARWLVIGHTESIWLQPNNKLSLSLVFNVKLFQILWPFHCCLTGLHLPTTIFLSFHYVPKKILEFKKSFSCTKMIIISSIFFSIKSAYFLNHYNLHYGNKVISGASYLCYILKSVRQYLLIDPLAMINVYFIELAPKLLEPLLHLYNIYRALSESRNYVITEAIRLGLEMF